MRIYMYIYESGLRIPGPPPNGMVPQAHALGNPGHQGMTTVHPGLPNTRQSYIRIYT